MNNFNNEVAYNELYDMDKCCKKDKHDHHDCHDRYNCVTTKKIHYKPCEFCKKVETKPIDLNKCSDRLLKLKVTINNVCFDKEISVGVILCDCYGKTVDFKCFTAVLHKDCHSCYDKSCGTLTRKVTFTIPKSDVCCPLNLTARIVANYTSPCDDYDPCC